ncbi:NUDIX domain-containing protein [Agarilytica rhodophyticola]|uniref:NUDIX domain-containing protein n=1 Tax=Agarilytica rhodophyticola TaxID=1737490 RepID=UPI000B348BE9|nr:NUDIX domain-containing protein [Agarilytica rhodophyticola]
MPNSKPKFGRDDVKVDSDQVVFDGFFKVNEVKLKHRLFDGGWSDDVVREVFHRGEASAAILYDPKNDIVGLIEQFRVGALDSQYGPWCLEVVAGMLEEGETPEMLIRRELKEEAGIIDTELIHISSYYSTPGGCGEKIHLYCALCDLSNAGGIHGLPSENEDILLHLFSAEEVFAVMLNSRMNNAATLLGLQWLQINRKSLKND